jgi:type I restriction enzyme, S subunit
MIHDLKPYPAYKDSGVPWLGEVPEHWKFNRAKWLFQKMNRPVRPDDDVVTCFRDGTVTLRKNRRVSGFTESLKEIGYQGVRSGDLVIHAMDAFAGAIGVSDSDGKCTPVYSVCQPFGNVNSNYYAYIVREMAYSQWIVALAKGIRERSTDFRYDGFASQNVPIPPRQEQDQIVAFIDRIDRRIWHYIRAKKKLIKLLEEQKQAIIHQAVTRGLDASVKLKPSGIEWLGEVPEHWKIVSLRYLATKFGSGVTPRGGATVYKQEGIPFLRSQNIHFDGLRLVNVAYIDPDLHQQLSSTHVRPQDVLLNITGASIGRVCAVPENFKEGNVNQHVCIIRPITKVILAEYLAAYLSTPQMQREIRIEQNGASREGLAQDAIRSFKILLPPTGEQTKIIQSIRQQTQKLISFASYAEDEISLLREYRTRLIADVVTGKLDVREATANLHEETDETESLDDALGGDEELENSEIEDEQAGELEEEVLV